MNQPRVARRLAAVLCADIRGYSRLMSLDELGTHRRAKASLALFREMTSKFGGRVVSHRGDGMLAHFGSAIDALDFALEFQKRIREDSSDWEEDQRIEFRIGINVADILVERGNIFGDGVNVAKRLEEMAIPGGISISRTVYDQARGKLECGFEYLGPQMLKNIVEPVDVYRVRIEPVGAVLSPSVRPRNEPLLLPARPSIAVLPFANLSEEKGQDYFCDGITEDIITNLSRFRELFVIARSSSFLYKGLGVKPAQIGRDLGVRYLLTGSVRPAGPRMRITAQLIEASSGHQLWASSFDRNAEDLFDLQDEVTRTIAAQLATRMELVERRRLVAAETRNLEAYALVLRGQDSFFKYTMEGNEQARRWYEQAIERDPLYARAYAALSRTYNSDWLYLWTDSPADCLPRALMLARKAVELDDSDPRGHAQLAFVYLWRKQLPLAIQEYELALSLNPNDADILAEYGDTLAYNGQPEEGVALIRQAMRLNPFYPDWYLWYLADAYYALRQYRDAIAALHQMRNPGESHRLLAASYAQLGEMAEAGLHAAEVLRRQPNFSARRWTNIQPEADPAEIEHYVEGLLKAGLPE